jgi:ABC-2 type transport system permease protein
MSLKRKNVQLILGCIITVVSFFLLFMVIAIGMYGKEMGLEKLLFYISNGFVFLIIATAIGYLVSVFVRGFNVLNMVCNIVSLGMSFLGGVFVQREILGDGVIAVSRFIPTYWYVNAVYAIQNVESNRGLIKDIYTSIGIEAIFAIAIFAVALVATRIKSEARAA